MILQAQDHISLPARCPVLVDRAAMFRCVMRHDAIDRILSE
jgi:hypothetical protein